MIKDLFVFLGTVLVITLQSVAVVAVGILTMLMAAGMLSLIWRITS